MTMSYNARLVEVVESRHRAITAAEAYRAALNAAVSDGVAIEDIVAVGVPAGDIPQLEPATVCALDADGVVELVERVVAACVFNRMLPAIDERLNRLGDPELARRRETELREYLWLVVQLRLVDRDPLAVDWQGDEGRELITGLLDVVYEELEGLEEQ